MPDLEEDWRLVLGLAMFVIGWLIILEQGLSALPTCPGWCPNAVEWTIVAILALAVMFTGFYLVISWKSRRREAGGLTDPRAGNFGGYLRSDPWLRSGEPRPPPPKS